MIDYADINAAAKLLEGLWFTVSVDPSAEEARRYRVECWDYDGVTGIGRAHLMGYAMENAWNSYQLSLEYKRKDAR